MGLEEDMTGAWIALLNQKGKFDAAQQLKHQQNPRQKSGKSIERCAASSYDLIT